MPYILSISERRWYSALVIAGACEIWRLGAVCPCVQGKHPFGPPDILEVGAHPPAKTAIGVDA